MGKQTRFAWTAELHAQLGRLVSQREGSFERIAEKIGRDANGTRCTENHVYHESRRLGLHEPRKYSRKGHVVVRPPVVTPSVPCLRPLPVGATTLDKLVPLASLGQC